MFKYELTLFIYLTHFCPKRVSSSRLVDNFYFQSDNLIDKLNLQISENFRKIVKPINF